MAWYAAYDVRVQRVRSDNAFAYRHSHAFQQAVAEVGAVQRFIRPGRPETNGKVERLNRTMLEEWAYQQPYASNEERAAALPAWLHPYNMHRAHTALGGRPPITRINNPAGQYS